MKSLRETFPMLADEWDRADNDLPSHVIATNSRQRGWWVCENGHRFSGVPKHRTSKNRASSCAECLKPKDGETFKDLYPDLAIEWDRGSNELRSETLPPRSGKRGQWLCSEGHVWEATIANRTSQLTGCPFCTGKSILPDFNDLKTLRPDVAKIWSPSNTVSVTEVGIGSHRKVWWTCPNGHDWEAAVSEVVRGRGCHFCSPFKKKVLPGYNDLATVKPHLVSEWSTKNTSSPSDVLPFTRQKVFWVCPKGHEWSATVGSRSRGNGCPICFNRISKPERELFESLRSFIPDLTLDVTLPVKWGRWKSSRCDMVSGNMKLVVEYDGWFYHKDREDVDTQKTNALIESGWRVVRVRADGGKGKGSQAQVLRHLTDTVAMQVRHAVSQPIDEVADAILKGL